MRKRKAHISKRSITSLLLIPFLFAIAACDGTLQNPIGSETPSSEQPSQSDPSGEAPPTESKPPIPLQDTESDALKIYWLTAENEDFALKASPLQLEGNLNESEQLTQALKRLMKGPANADVSTAIPPETQLNRLSIKNDGIHVDVSKDFTSGGGSLSMQSRLGQIIYTASSVNPKTPIWVSVDGEPLTVLGGEGLEISQPMTRDEFSKEFSL